MPETTLDLMLTARDGKPGPRKDPVEAEKKEEEGAERDGDKRSGGGGFGIGRFFLGLFSFLSSDDDREDGDKVEPPLRLSVQVVDARGRAAKVLLNDYGPVRRPIEIRIARRDDQQYAGNTEMVLQSYSIPLGDFLSGGADRVDLNQLKEVRLLFDESKAGSVVVDEVGFSRMNPAFLSVSGSR